MKKIWLDMDGTIADLYAVPNWLEMLRSYDATPYFEAKPIVNMNVLARYLNKCQKNGYKICIVSALSKQPTPEYNAKVIEAKKKWLTKHLHSVNFDEMRFVPYTFKKNDVNTGNDILFDDEERHINAWTGKAYYANEILSTLKSFTA